MEAGEIESFIEKLNEEDKLELWLALTTPEFAKIAHRFRYRWTFYKSYNRGKSYCKEWKEDFDLYFKDLWPPPRWTIVRGERRSWPVLKKVMGLPHSKENSMWCEVGFNIKYDDHRLKNLAKMKRDFYKVGEGETDGS